MASASAGAGPGPPADADADRPAAGIYAAQPVPGGLGPPVSVGALRWDWGLAAGNTERGLVGIAVRLWPLLQQGWSLCMCKLGCVG